MYRGWDAVVQFEEGLEEFPLGVAEEFHVGAGLAAAEHSAEGDDQDVVQGMAAGVAGAGVFQGAEQVGELGHGGVSSASTSLHARRRWPLSYRTPQNPYAIALAILQVTIDKYLKKRYKGRKATRHAAK